MLQQFQPELKVFRTQNKFEFIAHRLMVNFATKELIGTILVMNRTEPLQSDHFAATKIVRKLTAVPTSKRALFHYTNRVLAIDPSQCTISLRIKRKIDEEPGDVRHAEHSKHAENALL